MTFEESVTQFIRNHQLIHPHMRLVAGVSGGADSMALLSYLCTMRRQWLLELAVCSVDHGLRGAEGRADLEFVRTFCEEKNVMFFGRRVDVRSFSRKRKLSLEAAARELRYKAFAETVELFRADALVLAHHGDDQIETMLMRATRGSVGPARAGIPVRRPFAGVELVRPFLTQTKSFLEDYCREQGIRPRCDVTNSWENHTRNRFRKYVLPFLKRENPSVHLKFQYESERLADDEAFLIQLAEAQLKEVVIKKSNDLVKLSIPALLSLPSPLQRRAIHLILNYLYMNQRMKPLHQSIHIEHLLQLLRSDRASGGTFFPKGFAARKSYEICLVGRFSLTAEKGYDVVLNIPGRTECPAGVIDAEFLEDNLCPEEKKDRQNRITIDCPAISFPLIVRSPLPGDRIMPVGMKHAQKIHRIFINEKIDRLRRSRWPLIVDGKGTAIWLPLLRKALLPESEQSGEKTKYLTLTFTPHADFGRTQE